jgi:hypothetical protein
MVATLFSIFTIFDGIAKHMIKNLGLDQIKITKDSATFNLITYFSAEP